jgi:hypothetical protein
MRRLLGVLSLQAMLGCSTPDRPTGATNGSAGTGTQTLNAIDGMHRLNSSEYNRTVQDALGTSLELADSSWMVGELAGFDNASDALGVTDTQYGRYFKAAQAVSADVMASERLRAPFASCDLAEDACVRSSIQALGLRLFRRPLADVELDTYRGVFMQARALGEDERSAMTLTLQALLSSAEFLYRIELDPEPTSKQVHPLTGYELASRLSYFLWSSAPDPELLGAAADGSLSNPDQLSRVVDRMLGDDKQHRFNDNFAGQWLGARRVPSLAFRSPTNWSRRAALEASQEMLSFFSEFLDRSWFEFPTLDVNYLSGDLELLYGVTDIPGYVNQRRVYPDDHRAGFFGLVGFLALTSLDSRTSPPRRGKWIAANFLCTPPPPPGKPVPMLEASTEGADPATLDVRQALERHRTDPTCASCHALFDAYGLALEQFDQIGQYRTNYPDGSVIDPRVELPVLGRPEPEMVSGLEDLSRAVSQDSRFPTCFASKLLTYALGTQIEMGSPEVEQVVGEWLKPGQMPSVRRLIHAIVSSDAFRFRRGGG